MALYYTLCARCKKLNFAAAAHYSRLHYLLPSSSFIHYFIMLASTESTGLPLFFITRYSIIDWWYTFHHLSTALNTTNLLSHRSQPDDGSQSWPCNSRFQALRCFNMLHTVSLIAFSRMRFSGHRFSIVGPLWAGFFGQIYSKDFHQFSLMMPPPRSNYLCW